MAAADGLAPASGSEPPRPPRDDRRALRTVGFVIGLGFLGAAVLAVSRQGDLVSDALAHVRSAGPGRIIALGIAVLGNIVLSGLTFSVLMDRFGTVGRGEMVALIGASGLLNFLPLRAGLLGRVAYHKAVNGIPATASLRVLLEALVISLTVAAWMLGAALLAGVTAIPLWGLVLAPVVLLVIGAVRGALRPWCLAAILRFAEMLIWALRYDLAFDLIGKPIDVTAAIGCAGVAVVSMLVPFVGNGLGVREWAIGLFAPFLSENALAAGLTADLMNRAIEIPVIAAFGLVAIGWIVARRRAATR
ncbi:MAG: hypothetical protein ACYTGR_08165 [Planctomycetota bacterium]